MSRCSRKILSVFMVLAFVFQLVAPAVTWAEENQKATIDKAIAEYQATYDQIMALEPIELGGIANFTIGAIDTVKSWGADIKGFFTGESDEERAARKKQEEYDKYKAQIDRANQDIEQLKKDAQATMDALKSGQIAAAGATDTTRSYNTIAETGGALGVYQKALTEAGNKLVDIGGKISTAGTVLAAITAILVVVAIPFPVVAPAIPILKGVTVAVEIASGVVTAAGNTLLTAAAKAITDDKGFLEAAALETALQTVDTGSGFVLDAMGAGVVAKTASNATIGGLTSTIRDINRTGATGSEAGQIAATNFANSTISSVAGAMFNGIVGQASKGITADILSDPKLGSTFKSDKSQEAFGDAVNSVLDLGLDGAKSDMIDSLTIQEENPKANDQPSLGGSW